MREIKFRMWDGLTQKYFTDQFQVMDCLKQQASGLYDHQADGSVFEQYTGLKDKNGVEIYEGDVVILKGEDYFSNEYFTADEDWTFKGVVSTDYYMLSFVSDDKCRIAFEEALTEGLEIGVTGNIHDNPTSA